MQTSTSPAPAAPAAPAPPPAAAAPAVVAGQPLPSAATLSPEQAALLRARREELQEQSENVSERRAELAEQHRMADDGAQSTLAQRIGVLDQQLIDIERDLAQTNRELLGAPPPPAEPVIEEPRVFGGFTSEEATAMGTVFMLVVLMPLAIAYARLLWKRATRIERAPVVLESPQTQQRMERVEQAVDAIAIEVERVAEGQRFVTKLLSEGRAGVPIAAGREREPVLVEDRARDRQPG